MTVTLNSYLFRPEEFSTACSKYAVSPMCKVLDFDTLRHDAISAFDTSIQVKRCADYYGGWDRSELLKEGPSAHEDDADIGFWLILILYRCLLGDRINLPRIKQPFAELDRKIFKNNGYDSYVYTRMLYGRPLSDICIERPSNTHSLYINNCHNILQQTVPCSTASRISWLSYAEIKTCAELYGHINACKDEKESFSESITSTLAIYHELYNSTISINPALGLCLISSG